MFGKYYLVEIQSSEDAGHVFQSVRLAGNPVEACKGTIKDSGAGEGKYIIKTIKRIY